MRHKIEAPDLVVHLIRVLIEPSKGVNLVVAAVRDACIDEARRPLAQCPRDARRRKRRLCRAGAGSRPGSRPAAEAEAAGPARGRVGHDERAVAAGMVRVGNRVGRGRGRVRRRRSRRQCRCGSRKGQRSRSRSGR